MSHDPNVSKHAARRLSTVQSQRQSLDYYERRSEDTVNADVGIGHRRMSKITSEECTPRESLTPRDSVVMAGPDMMVTLSPTAPGSLLSAVPMRKTVQMHEEAADDSSPERGHSRLARRSASRSVLVDLNSKAVDAQLLSKDRMLVLIELPLCTLLALQPLRAAALLVQQGQPALISLAAPAFLYWLSCLLHALALASAPAVAMRRRRLMWGLRLDIALPLLQLSNILLLPKDVVRLSPLRGLMLLSAKWGLVNIGDSLFLKTLPAKVRGAETSSSDNYFFYSLCLRSSSLEPVFFLLRLSFRSSCTTMRTRA